MPQQMPGLRVSLVLGPGHALPVLSIRPWEAGPRPPLGSWKEGLMDQGTKSTAGANVLPWVSFPKVRPQWGPTELPRETHGKLGS